jgi:hypothetical protein
MAEERDIAQQLIEALGKIAELERAVTEHKQEAINRKLRQELAERRLDDIEHSLAPVAPVRAGSSPADRVRQVAQELMRSRQELEQLRVLRRTAEDARARWESIAERVTAAVRLDARNVKEQARMVALYADAMMAEVDARFSHVVGRIEIQEEAELVLTSETRTNGPD